MREQSDLSYKNRAILEKHPYCSCYFCLNSYKTSIIHDYVDGNLTALCPLCGIDSVVCFKDGTLPTRELLLKWHNESFSCDEIDKQKNEFKRKVQILMKNNSNYSSSKLYALKKSNRKFFLLDIIALYMQDGKSRKSILLYDISYNKQIIVEQKLFKNKYKELDIKEKEEFYSKKLASNDYRLVYSEQNGQLSIHQNFYFGKTIDTLKNTINIFPANIIDYTHAIGHKKNEDLRVNLQKKFKIMQTAFAQPVIIED